MSKQWIAYLSTITALILFSIFLTVSQTWAGNTFWHTYSGFCTVILTFVISLIMFVYYYTDRSNQYLLIAIGFFATCVFEVYHVIMTMPSLVSLAHSQFPIMLVWTWFLGRALTAIFLLMSLVHQRKQQQIGAAAVLSPFKVIIYTALVLVTVMFILSYIRLPIGSHGQWFFARPQEFIVAAVFLYAAWSYHQAQDLEGTVIKSFLAWFLLANGLMELLFMGISKAPFDSLFNGAIFIKLMSCLVFFVGLCIDIAARFKQSKDNLKQAQAFGERYEQSNQDLEEFAYVASHDLKEPLRKIQMFSTLLTHECRESVKEDAQYYIDGIVKCVERMSALIEALLVYTRITRKTGEFSDVNLNAISEEVVDLMHTRVAHEHGDVIVDSKMPTIYGEATQMRQLFQNLIGNGLKFKSPDRDPIIKISATIKVLGNDYTLGHKKYCEIKFADNGIGFDDKYQDRIFRVFQRLEQKQDRDSTGIGLAVCKKIVERHGGTIRLSSVEGKGTDVIVTLPLAGR